MGECLFCKIIKKEIPSSIVFENEKVIGFKDIFPQAKEHFLFIHKLHTKDLRDLIKKDKSQAQDILCAIDEFLDSSEELAENGFRVVTNSGKNGGQTVFHTHFHLLGGESLKSFGA